MSTFRQPGHVNPNKLNQLGQTAPLAIGNPLQPYRDSIYLLTTTLCAYLLVTLDHGFALCWSLALCVFVTFILELGPRLHKSLLVQFVMAVVAGYLAFVTGALIRHHLLHMICTS
ncbi:MAG TPA: hypothetical protein VGG56_11605 [Terracidiphilus sp.]|jgi:hypothetical protein